jgi:hypothetical protein
MGMLDALLGGMGQQGFQDFTQRYDRGSPWDGIDDRETAEHYGRIAPQLGGDDYRQAAEASLSRLSPEERAQLVQQMQSNARRSDMNFPGLHGDGLARDPGMLAGVFSQMHQQQPGMLQQLLGGGGGGGGAFANPIAKAAMAGIAAMAVKKLMGGR